MDGGSGGKGLSVGCPFGEVGGGVVILGSRRVLGGEVGGGVVGGGGGGGVPTVCVCVCVCVCV